MNDEKSVVGFNDYEGGELVADGIEYNIRDRPFRFCASENLHSVNPITSGCRFSVVFFRPRFSRQFQDKYGSTLTYDQLYAPIPLRNLNQPVSEVRIPTDSF